MGKYVALVVGNLVALLLLIAPVGSALAAEPGPAGCGYGRGGPYDTTLCWIDMSGLNLAQAESSAGQPMSIGLPGGNTISFVARVAPGPGGLRPPSARAFPTWSGTPIGNAIYLDTPGKPALYESPTSGPGGAGAVVTLSNISVTGPSGVPSTGYAFVMADAESTNSGEYLTFGSDKPITKLAEATPAGYTAPCGGGLTGLGTTSVRCDGSAGRVGDLLTISTAPSQVQMSYGSSSGGGQQGFAFGVLTAKVALTKTISSPVDAGDGFGIEIADDSGGTVATANTGGGASATTGVVTVLANTPSRPFTFSETPNAGTSPTPYRQSWACTRNGAAEPATSGAKGTSQTIAVAIGDDVRCTIANEGPRPSLSLVKGAKLNDTNGNGLADLGETIDYTFTVSNTGNRPLTNIGVDDPKVGAVACEKTTLEVGEGTKCTATYTVTQADVDAGQVANSATAEGTPPDGRPPVTSPPSDTNTPTPSANPAIAVVKGAQLNDTNGNGVADVGETIDYSFEVTNTGNQTLTGVTVEDPLVTGITCAATTLTPGASTTCTADPYTVTQADVDADQVANSATARGTSPGGNEVPSPPSETNTPTSSPDPAIAVVKDAELEDTNGNGLADLGETIKYTFTVSNTGNQTLTGVAVSDNKVGAVTCTETTLAPGASTKCTAAPYTVTQADVDAGQVVNSATAQGDQPGGGTVTSPPSRTNTPASSPDPNIAVVKRAKLNDTNANGKADLGETIEYTFTVSNTGNQTLTGVGVADSLVGPVTCAETTLAPLASTTCTAAPYTVTQADVDAGQVVNSATSQGTAPGGGTVTSPPSRTNTPTTNPDPTIAILKQAQLNDTNGNGRADVGETIDFTFEVTNTGNQTLTGVGVADNKVGAVTCAATTLAPLATTTCTAAPYTVTQADVDAGEVVNLAVAQGTPPTPPGATGQMTPVTSGPSTTETPVSDPDPAIALVKRAKLADTNGNGLADLGETIEYSFAVTNTGNLTLHGLGIEDAKVSANCPTTTLAPGASTTCTATYTVTRADLDAGKVANTATARGLRPGGGSPIVSDPSSTETPTGSPPAEPAPPSKPAPPSTPPSNPPAHKHPRPPKPKPKAERARLQLTKSTAQRRIRAGHPFDFTITVRSVGPQAARDVKVCDRLPAGLVFVAAPHAAFRNGEACWHVPTLHPGAKRTYTIRVRPTATPHPKKIVNRASANATNAARTGASAPVVTVLPGRPSRPGGVTG